MSSVDAPHSDETRPITIATADRLLRAAATHNDLPDVPRKIVDRTLMRVHLASRKAEDSGVNLAMT